MNHGYAVVVQDVRGRYKSGGVFEPINQEVGDGDDTLNWIARQPWSDGGVGMYGGSYLGIAQWKAALTHNPHLRAMFPYVSGDDDYRDRFYSPGGAMKLGHRLLWLDEEHAGARGFTPPADFPKIPSVRYACQQFAARIQPPPATLCRSGGRRRRIRPTMHFGKAPACASISKIFACRFIR